MTDDPMYHVDGDLEPASEATVSVDDRAFATATPPSRRCGPTADRSSAGTPTSSASSEPVTHSLEHGLAAGDLRARIDETLAANDLADAYVRLSITRGVQPKLTPRPRSIRRS